tara:strand:+ start:422 stop:724 length:303 start_codon:yes stop_codon:yes gene_type:complete
VITNIHQKRYDAVKNDPVRVDLYDRVKSYSGRTAREYADDMNKRPSDINRHLRSMENGGLIYSAPLPKNTNVHGWHINTLDMEAKKTKIVTQLWNRNLKL